jgi:hypothetical protein
MKVIRSAIRFLYNLCDVLFMRLGDFTPDIGNWCDPLPEKEPPQQKQEPEEVKPVQNAEVKVNCCHLPEVGEVAVWIIGKEHNIFLPIEMEMCSDCFEKWLNLNSITCPSCDKPILPGSKVADISPEGTSEITLTHVEENCCGDPSLYCGIWGPGQLVTLHDLFPNLIPPGTHTMKEFFRSRPGFRGMHVGWGKPRTTN